MSKKVITGDDGKKYTVKEKKPFYKKWWFWVLIVIIAIIVFAGISSGSSDNSASSSSSVSSRSTSSSVQSNSSSTNEQSSSITNTSSSKEDNNSLAKAITLSAGEYTVGQQIQPGRYIIKAISGSGNLTSEGGGDINVILGQQPDNSDGQVSSYTATLTKGMSIKLDGINQTSFTPVVGRKYLTQLPAGQWVVGKDIKPGRYKITVISGSGNLTSDDGDINAILGTTTDQDTGQVTSVTEDLHKGEIITSDIQEINLSAE